MLAIGTLHCILMKSTKRFLRKIFVEEEERRSEIALCGRACARKQSAVSVVKNRDILSHHQKDFTERFLVKRSSRRKNRSIWCKPNARNRRLAATKARRPAPIGTPRSFRVGEEYVGKSGYGAMRRPLVSAHSLLLPKGVLFLIPSAVQNCCSWKILCFMPARAIT